MKPEMNERFFSAIDDAVSSGVYEYGTFLAFIEQIERDAVESFVRWCDQSGTEPGDFSMEILNTTGCSCCYDSAQGMTVDAILERYSARKE